MHLAAEFVVHADSPEVIMEKAKAFLQDQAKEASPKGRKARPQEALAKVGAALHPPAHVLPNCTQARDLGKALKLPTDVQPSFTQSRPQGLF